VKPHGGEDRERSENHQRQYLRGPEWRLRLGRSQFLSRRRSQEFDERVGRLFWIFLQHPMSGVFEDDDGHICRNQLSLLA